MTQLSYRSSARFPIGVVLRHANQKGKCRLLLGCIAGRRDYSLTDLNVFHSFIKTLNDRHHASIMTLPNRMCRLSSNLFVFRFIANEAGQEILFAPDLTKPVDSGRTNSLIR